MTPWRHRGLAASFCGTAVLAAWTVAGVPPLDSPRTTKPVNTGFIWPVHGTTEKESDLAAKATASDRGHPRDKESVRSTEILDECFVPEICIDRYLWAVYQRTPKHDVIKVMEERKVTVKKKGKTRTIVKKIAKLVNEDFTWKDLQAAERAGLSVQDYVIGGIDPSFKLKLFQALCALEDAGLSPGITSAFRDDYRQSITSGLKAATDRSFHGGSFRGGYGHGLAADVVSVNGATHEASERLWEWIDTHGKEFGIGRPYLDKDPQHVAPVDGEEYASHHSDAEAQPAKKSKKPVVREDQSTGKRLKTAKPVKGSTV